MNYKTLINDIASIAYHHQQISSFGFGDITQATMNNTTLEAPKYSRCYVVPDVVTLHQNHIGFKFSIIVMDKVKLDLSNQAEVLSDTKEIQKDIWTIFYRSYLEKYGAFTNYEMGDWNPSVIPFLDKYDDGVIAGWNMQINIDIPFDYNKCNPPMNTPFQFVQDEVFQTYKTVIDDLITFGNDHAQLKSVAFGDITQLTMDNNTKKAPKYPRMFIIPNNSAFDTNLVNMSFNIIICDRLKLDLMKNIGMQHVSLS